MDNYIYLLLWVIGLLAYITISGCIYMIYEALTADQGQRPMARRLTDKEYSQLFAASEWRRRSENRES